MPADQKAPPLFSSDEEFVKTTTALLRRLYALHDRAEEVSELNPFAAFRQLKALATELRRERPDYVRCLESSWVKMSTKITSGGLGASIIASNILAGSLPFYLRLQDARSRVTATIDYKRAYAVAIVALYISILSCGLSLALALA